MEILPKRKRASRSGSTPVPSWVWIPAIVCSALLIVFLMIVFFRFPVMTGDQKDILHILIAFTGGFAAFFMGGTAALHFDFPKGGFGKVSLSATSGLAVLFVLYLLAPFWYEKEGNRKTSAVNPDQPDRQPALTSKPVVTPPLSIAADLLVSPLDSPVRLAPLEGYSIVYVAGAPVYAGGCKVRFTLSHNRKGPHTVSVHNVALHVARFLAGVDPLYAYEFDADKVRGRGPREPHTFIVKLDGARAVHATWRRGKDLTEDVTADSLAPVVFDLNDVRGDDTQDIRGTILLDRAGSYEVFFSFAYTVGGAEREQRSRTIRLYRQE